MTSCQEYLLKIKLGEMNSIWRAHIWNAKEEMLKQLSFDLFLVPVHVHGTG